MDSQKKICVIGASIAGPALCFWLKKYGFEPTLIERSRALRKGGYAIDIRGIAIDVAKMMGVYDAVVDNRTSIKTARHVNASGKLIHEECGESFGYREGEDVEIVRSRLVDILMQNIGDVPCRFNCYAIKIQQHDDYVDVEFNDGSTEQFDIVIGADGLHSSTRRHIFSANEYTKHDLGSYISVFTAPNHWDLNHASLFCEKGEKSIHISSDHNPTEALVGLMFRSEMYLNDIKNRDEQIAFLHKTFQDFGWQIDHILPLLNNSNDLYFDSITQVKMPSWTKHRVALVGDSGYCASPLSGQGTSLAMVGAYILAGELKLSQDNHEEAFKQYNEKMRPYVEKNQALGAWVSEFFLVEGGQSSESLEQRSQEIMDQLKIAANAITLPAY